MPLIAEQTFISVYTFPNIERLDKLTWPLLCERLSLYQDVSSHAVSRRKWNGGACNNGDGSFIICVGKNSPIGSEQPTLQRAASHIVELCKDLQLTSEESKEIYLNPRFSFKIMMSIQMGKK